MIGLRLHEPPETVLALGAHADDIEIGAFGLLSTLAQQHESTGFHFVVLTGNDDRKSEATKSMRALLGDQARLHAGDFRDGFLPYDDPAGVKSFLRDSLGDLKPDVVIGPREDDRHQDHALIGSIVGQLFRDQLVLSYEIPKYDADLGRPQVFVPLTAQQAQTKIDHLTDHFASQQGRHWYSDDAFRALMRVRGLECKAPEGFAEAFHVSKVCLV